ncbi:hypothetical protein ACIPSA_06405 [Streptomyces sp. NPDC086549]|uniref:hypothetical protein n=1 Tax=Streptomyces sp. NPDC086549 TaxID=3365752 RepID=UPI0037F398D9
MTRPDEPDYVYYVLYDEDFGLSGLAGELAAGALSPGDDQVGDEQLGKDARLLLDSSLSGDMMRTLWLAACRERFDPAGHGMDMGSWLRRLSDEHPPPRKKSEPRPTKYLSTIPFTPPRPVLVEEEMREAVLAEIRASEQDLARAVPLPDALPALRRVVAEVDADLGFRLFLRLLKAYGVRVGKEQYDRFLELSDPFEYHVGVVRDDLAVDWPPIDTTRRDTIWDFGLSSLTDRFHDHRYDDTARDVVRECAEADDAAQTPGTAAAVLLEDVLRLLESPLSTDAITALWLVASDAGLRLDRYGIDARQWLEQIADVCRERLRDIAPDHRFVLAPPARTELRDEVLRELRDIAPQMATRSVSPGWQSVPGAAAVEALEQVVAQVDHDLGFRLLLRALNGLAVPLTEERYARYQALGERFGYGEFHVSRVDHLLEQE